MGSNFVLNFYFSVFKLFQMSRKLFSNYPFVKLSEICFLLKLPCLERILKYAEMVYSTAMNFINLLKKGIFKID